MSFFGGFFSSLMEALDTVFFQDEEKNAEERSKKSKPKKLTSNKKGKKTRKKTAVKKKKRKKKSSSPKRKSGGKKKGAKKKKIAKEDSDEQTPLERSEKNPIMGPKYYAWENAAAFNPAAVYLDGRVHLLYRAMGNDGQSRIGYANSRDGIHIDERLPYPVYEKQKVLECPAPRIPMKALREYRPGIFASGGGWFGCEDPRMVVIEDYVYLIYTAFAGWDSVRIAVSRIAREDFLNHEWNWTYPVFLSPRDEVHKNWVLFPEKIDGKYAVLHNLHHEDTSRVRVDYIEDLFDFDPEKTRFESPDPHAQPDCACAWHKRMRAPGSPPMKTDEGWLVLYHAHDEELKRYKMGAMLLDLDDPSKVIHRAQAPMLSPEEWYENDWKPGIIYASGAIIKNDTLFVYYGAGDKHVGVATADVDVFLDAIMHDKPATLEKHDTTDIGMVDSKKAGNK